MILTCDALVAAPLDVHAASPPSIPFLQPAAAVTRKILTHPSYVQAKRLSIYISMPTGELRTDDLVKDALENGKPATEASDLKCLSTRSVSARCTF